MQSSEDLPGAPRATSAARRIDLEPGLHFVATPIGAARDITLRALDVLLSADVLAAEDTRSARRLLEIHGIPLAGRPLIAYHDHSGPRDRSRLLRHMADGESVAYLSEAGTPLVADPGYRLARDAIDVGHRVSAAPGPTAAVMALSVSGLPTDRFLFAGFPPSQRGARKRFLAELESAPATLILYESPKRIHRILDDLCDAWDDTRPAVLCRELTKRFEEMRRGTLAELRQSVADNPPRGELVLVIGRGAAPVAAEDAVDDALRDAMGRLRLKEAAAEVAALHDMPRREVYQRALVMKNEDAEGEE